MGKIANANQEVKDAYGFSTLESNSMADKSKRSMHESIKPACIRRILELGVGIRNISKYFLAKG